LSADGANGSGRGSAVGGDTGSRAGRANGVVHDGGNGKVGLVELLLSGELGGGKELASAEDDHSLTSRT
jgi:hypothetical protein